MADGIRKDREGEPIWTEERVNRVIDRTNAALTKSQREMIMKSLLSDQEIGNTSLSPTEQSANTRVYEHRARVRMLDSMVDFMLYTSFAPLSEYDKIGEKANEDIGEGLIDAGAEAMVMFLYKLMGREKFESIASSAIEAAESDIGAYLEEAQPDYEHVNPSVSASVDVSLVLENEASVEELEQRYDNNAKSLTEAEKAWLLRFSSPRVYGDSPFE